ncbi:hypothetical protein Celaphus_00008180 [Cervus elaphus hippelaphus]|uniref:Uncharacterized protein n=1 Tax=Cervus elaphus hippelaphus TaxID=46360 RepID=A0A212CPQ1_CEREH|nr:hypothetical protein Celaphus_00008180 [Cervus elaphus hippelaphus]
MSEQGLLVCGPLWNEQVRPPGMFANCKYCYSKLLLPGARNCEHCLVSSADQRRNSSPPPAFCFRELLLAPAPPRRTIRYLPGVSSTVGIPRCSLSHTKLHPSLFDVCSVECP